MKNYIKVENKTELERVLKSKRCNLYILMPGYQSHISNKLQYNINQYLTDMYNGVLFYTEKPSTKYNDSINFIKSL